MALGGRPPRLRALARILPPREQRLVSRQIDLRVRQQHRITLELTLRLVERGEERTRIDEGEQFAGLDDLPFSEGDLDQRAVDLRMHRYGGERGHGTQRIDRNGYIAGAD